jgi:hypothetical protein
MTKPNQKRSRLFIDAPLQGMLLLRVGLYWMVCVLTQVLIIYLVAVVASMSAAPSAFSLPPQQLRWLLQLVVFASALLLPVILFDVLRLSHRWVGPVFRLRTALQALSRGEKVAPISFRAGDFWQEMAGDFNVVAADANRRKETATEEVNC